jgi:hypothetical protein
MVDHDADQRDVDKDPGHWLLDRKQHLVILPLEVFYRHAGRDLDTFGALLKLQPRTREHSLVVAMKIAGQRNHTAMRSLVHACVMDYLSEVSHLSHHQRRALIQSATDLVIGIYSELLGVFRYLHDESFHHLSFHGFVGTDGLALRIIR